MLSPPCSLSNCPRRLYSHRPLDCQTGADGLCCQRLLSCQTVSSSETTQLTCGVHQGSVLGPILFLMYTAQPGVVIQGYVVGRQLFADDSRLYESFHPDQASADVAVRNVEDCYQEVKKWMS